MIQRSWANWVRLVFTCPFLSVLMVLVSSWIGNVVGYIVLSFLVWGWGFVCLFTLKIVWVCLFLFYCGGWCCG